MAAMAATKGTRGQTACRAERTGPYRPLTTRLPGHGYHGERPMTFDRVAIVEHALDEYLEEAAPAPTRLAPDDPLRPGAAS